MIRKEIIKNHYTKHISEGDFNSLVIREDGYAVMYNDEGAQMCPCFKSLGLTEQYVEKNIDNGIDHQTNEMVWRPKSLQGLENNNGWIKIESESDLPKNDGEYHVCIDSKYSSTINYYKGKFCSGDFNFSFTYDTLNITHYQPIIKPKPPLF